MLHCAFRTRNLFDQEKQTIKNLLMKNLYPSYLINSKKSKNFYRTNLLLRKTPILFITRKAVLTRNYHILVLIQTVLRKEFISYVKQFAKAPMLNLFFHDSNCRTYFLQKIVCQLLWSPLLCTNLLVQDVNPSCSFRLKLKEALHITWLKPVLNK